MEEVTMFSKSKIGLALAAMMLPATPALAQAIAVGMQVTDSAGAPVGTVTAINGDTIVVKTDKHEAAVAKTSVTPANGKLLFGMTQAQLDAQIEKSEAAADASVKAGATVKGSAGTPIGTIESADADWVTIAIDPTHKLKIPRSGVRGNPDGTVTAGLTAADVQAELQKSATPAPAATPPK
jgi:preprotein translocase subunit YajC